MAGPILLVHDDIATIASVRRLLSREGYEVVLATSAADAVIAFGHELPELLILAPSVESGRGRVVLEELALHPDGKLARVVLLGETVAGFALPVAPLPLEPVSFVKLVEQTMRNPPDADAWRVVDRSEPQVAAQATPAEEWRATPPPETESNPLESALFGDMPPLEQPQWTVEEGASAEGSGEGLDAGAEHEAAVQASFEQEVEQQAIAELESTLPAEAQTPAEEWDPFAAGASSASETYEPPSSADDDEMTRLEEDVRAEAARRRQLREAAPAPVERSSKPPVDPSDPFADLADAEPELPAPDAAPATDLSWIEASARAVVDEPRGPDSDGAVEAEPAETESAPADEAERRADEEIRALQSAGTGESETESAETEPAPADEAERRADEEIRALQSAGTGESETESAETEPAPADEAERRAEEEIRALQSAGTSESEPESAETESASAGEAERRAEEEIRALQSAGTSESEPESAETESASAGEAERRAEEEIRALQSAGTGESEAESVEAEPAPADEAERRAEEEIRALESAGTSDSEAESVETESAPASEADHEVGAEIPALPAAHFVEPALQGVSSETAAAEDAAFAEEPPLPEWFAPPESVDADEALTGEGSRHAEEEIRALQAERMAELAAQVPEDEAEDPEASSENEGASASADDARDPVKQAAIEREQQRSSARRWTEAAQQEERAAASAVAQVEELVAREGAARGAADRARSLGAAARAEAARQAEEARLQEHARAHEADLERTRAAEQLERERAELEETARQLEEERRLTAELLQKEREERQRAVEDERRERERRLELERLDEERQLAQQQEQERIAYEQVERAEALEQERAELARRAEAERQALEARAAAEKRALEKRAAEDRRELEAKADAERRQREEYEEREGAERARLSRELEASRQTAERERQRAEEAQGRADRERVNREAEERGRIKAEAEAEQSRLRAVEMSARADAALFAVSSDHRHQVARVGTVDTSQLARLVVQLSASRTRARIELSIDNGRRALWLQDGGLVAVTSSAPRESIVDRARRDGLIDSRQEADLKLVDRSAREALEVMRERGMLREDEALPLLQRYVEQIALEALAEPRSHYRLADEAAPRDLPVVPPRPLIQLVVEALRRSVDVPALLEQAGGLRAVPDVRGAEIELGALDLTERERRLIRSADGQATLEALILESGLRQEAALKIVMVAQALGLLELRPPATAAPAPSPRLDAQRIDAKYEEIQSADYFSVLGISKIAGRDEVRRAYQLLSEEFHPMRFASHADPMLQRRAEEIHAVLAEAAHALEDDRLRVQYARNLAD